MQPDTKWIYYCTEIQTFSCIKDILTITDDIDITPVVAVVDAPAWEAALSNVGLIALAVDTREPDDPSTSAVRGAIACANGLSVTKHPAWGE